VLPGGTSSRLAQLATYVPLLGQQRGPDPCPYPTCAAELSRTWRSLTDSVRLSRGEGPPEVMLTRRRRPPGPGLRGAMCGVSLASGDPGEPGGPRVRLSMLVLPGLWPDSPLVPPSGDSGPSVVPPSAMRGGDRAAARCPAAAAIAACCCSGVRTNAPAVPASRTNIEWDMSPYTWWAGVTGDWISSWEQHHNQH
jgi:hypothetical protein